MTSIESESKQRLLSEEDGETKATSTKNSIDYTSDLPYPATFHNPLGPGRSRWSINRILLGTILLTSLTSNTIWFFNSILPMKSPEAICRDVIGEKGTPVLDDLYITYETITYNGSLLKQNIYKEAAGPEVDEAWQALGVQYNPFIVPEDQGERFGLSKSHVKRRPELGGGYIVYLEALHHLHCLDLLRQTSYWNYEYYLKEGKGAFENSERVVRLHTGHCLDILRQQLMCKADVSILGHVWIRDYGIYPDFNTKHRCKNFEAIRDWARDRQLREDVDADGKSVFAIREDDEVLDDIP